MSSLFEPNPNVLLFPSRLFAPSYSGPGRWVLFNAGTRQTFLASGGAKYAGVRQASQQRAGVGEAGASVSLVGGTGDRWHERLDGARHQDVLPDVLRVLWRLAQQPASVDALVDAGLVDRRERVQRLILAGLMVPTDAVATTLGPVPTGASVLARYHLAAFDYPFHDYTDPNWLTEDRAAMKRYKAQSPPPPAAKTYDDSRKLRLPQVEPRDLLRSATRFRLRDLAAVLRFTVGAIGKIESPVVGELLHKTSPSGGARHPTELAVMLRDGLEPCPAGAYHYDVRDHALARMDPALVRQLPSVNAPVTFLVTTSIERAMWRYRELRSFRPVVIDAGHVIETLVVLLAQKGLAAAVHTPAIANADLAPWLTEPPLALVSAGPEGEVDEILQAPAAPASSKHEPGRQLTNPFVRLSFDADGLSGSNAWPLGEATEPLGLSDVQVLSHCLPSTRGDRDTTPDGVNDAIPEVPIERLSALRQSSLLLTEDQARPLYRAVAMWANYGWYLSLHAYLEAFVASRRSIAAGEPPFSTWGAIRGQQLVGALLRRRTTRVFGDAPIEQVDLERLLGAAIVDNDPAREIRVGAVAVTGIEPGIYSWTPDRGLAVVRASLTRHEIREWTIGQKPAASCAAVVWLIQRMSLTRADEYLAGLLRLGRVAQRLCLHATAADLGVFLTPAVRDRLVLSELEVPEPLAAVAYLVGVGHPAADAPGCR